MQPDHDEHLQTLVVARDAMRSFAALFEQLLGTTSEPVGRAILTRNLAQADQVIADIGEQLDDEPRLP